jgi:hypothetical protein
MQLLNRRPLRLLGGFGGFGSKAGSGTGAGFATFGTAAAGSGTTASKFGFTLRRLAIRRQRPRSRPAMSVERMTDDNEESRDSDTDMGDDLGVDMMST